MSHFNLLRHQPLQKIVMFHMWFTCEVPKTHVNPISHVHPMWHVFNMWNSTWEISREISHVKFTCDILLIWESSHVKFHMWNLHVKFHMWHVNHLWNFTYVKVYMLLFICDFFAFEYRIWNLYVNSNTNMYNCKKEKITCEIPHEESLTERITWEIWNVKSQIIRNFTCDCANHKKIHL